MNIASKLSFHTEDVSAVEIKYLLWLSLIELAKHTGPQVQTIDEDESFNINELLDGLDVELGINV